MHAIDIFFNSVTALGDSGFVLPASAVLLAALLASADRSTALALGAGVITCAILTIAAKIIFMIYGAVPGRGAVHSPSGHASMATIFFSSFGLIVARSKGAGPGVGRIGAAACALLVALIAISRVRLHAHTWAETLIGVGIGLASFVVVLRFFPQKPAIGLRTLAIFILVAVFLYAAFGASVSIEEPLEEAAASLGRLLRR